MLRGVNVSPVVVAGARGIVEAAVLAGLVALADWLADGSVTSTLGTWAPILVLIVRQLEGIADQLIDPDQNRRPEP